MRVLVIALCLLSLCVPILADSAPTEDDIKLAQLENQTRARELYLAGDAASKKGDLQTAIWDWSQALNFKPDSAYTAKCLAQAREQLYKKYMATVSAKADAKDPISEYESAMAIIPLLPKRNDIADRAAKLKSGLNDDQKKALAAYEDGLTALALQDYTKAVGSFGTAQTFCREAICIRDAIGRLDALRQKSPELFPGTSGNGERVPQMVYIYATWCHYCTKMNPVIDAVKAQYGAKLSVVRIDGDENEAAAQRYNIDGYPTVIFLDSKGTEVDRISGYAPRDGLSPSLAKLGL